MKFGIIQIKYPRRFYRIPEQQGAISQSEILEHVQKPAGIPNEGTKTTIDGVSSTINTVLSQQSKKIPIVDKSGAPLDEEGIRMREISVNPMNQFSQKIRENTSLDFLFFELPDGDIVSAVLTANNEKGKVYTIRHGIQPFLDDTGTVIGMMQYPPFRATSLVSVLVNGNITSTSPLIKGEDSIQEESDIYGRQITSLLSQQGTNQNNISRFGTTLFTDNTSFPGFISSIYQLGYSSEDKEIFYADITDQNNNSIFQFEFRKYTDTNTESPYNGKSILYIGGMVNGSKDEKLLAKVTRWILSYSENLQVPDDTLVAFFRDDTHQYVSKIRTVGYYKNKIQQK